MAMLTTIAAGVSIAATAATTVGSFSQAHKQKKEMRKAEKEAKKSLMRAKKKLDVNFYEGLSIPMTPYEKERDALLSAGTQAMETAVEGEERGASATAGRLMAAQRANQADVSTRQGKQLFDLQKLVTAEDSRLQAEKMNLDLAEAEGAQLAARDAAQARAAAISQGFQGVTSLASQALDWDKNPYARIGGGQSAEDNAAAYTNINNTTTNTTPTTTPPVNNPMQTPSALNPYSYSSPFYTAPWGAGAPTLGYTPSSPFNL